MKKEKEDILKQFRSHFLASTFKTEQITRSKNAFEFYNGRQEAYKSFVKDVVSGAENTNPVVFNYIFNHISSIYGFMIQLKKPNGYSARLTDNQAAILFSDKMNLIRDYYREKGSFDQIENQALNDMLIGGYGMIYNYISFDNDPNGRVVYEHIPYDSAGWDKDARNINLTDSRFFIRKKRVLVEDIKEMFDTNEVSGDSDTFQLDSSFVGESGRGMQVGTLTTDGGDGRDRMDVYYYEWKEKEFFYRVKNPFVDLAKDNPVLIKHIYDNDLKLITADFEDDNLFNFKPEFEIWVLNKTNFQKIKDAIKSMEESYELKLSYVFDKKEMQRFQRDVIYGADLTNKQVLDTYIIGDTFSFKAITGVLDTNKGEWYGVAENLIQPCVYICKALTETIRRISISGSAGKFYETGAIINKDKFNTEMANFNANVELADGGLAKIGNRNNDYAPSGWEQVATMAMQALDKISVNPEFLGNADNKGVSALFEQQRVDQVISSLARYFDSLTLFQAELARVTLYNIRKIGKVGISNFFRFKNKDGSYFYEQVGADVFEADYDIITEELPTTKNQQQIANQQVLDFIQSLGTLGVANNELYTIAVDHLQVSEKDKAKLREALKPKEEQAPDPSLPLVMEQLEATIDQTRANTAKSQASIIKTLNEAEKIKKENRITPQDLRQNVADTLNTSETLSKEPLQEQQMPQQQITQQPTLNQ
jgi:hypothetical protein